MDKLENPTADKSSRVKASPHELQKATDLKGLLQQEFIKRLKINPQYSLRSFAQFLQLNSGTLSQIINGRRKIGRKVAQQIALKLNISPEELNLLSSEDYQFKNIEIDQFNVISDWYHFAIIELIKTENFKNRSQWIAKRLGITVSEVNIAIERLLRLNYIGKTQSGSLEVVNSNLSTLNDLSKNITSVAFKSYQKQVLTKSLVAIDSVPLEERLHTSLSTAINKEDLEKVKEILHRCRREINAFTESNPVKNEVYHLHISLYPVTLKNEKKEPK
ncbi:MAG: TIGR02147 family protein [Bdellovibrionales bacterium]|nr:TIGR02147 family protein [Bdellovibrionales bacterium]